MGVLYAHASHGLIMLGPTGLAECVRKYTPHLIWEVVYFSSEVPKAPNVHTLRSEARRAERSIMSEARRAERTASPKIYEQIYERGP